MMKRLSLVLMTVVLALAGHGMLPASANPAEAQQEGILDPVKWSFSSQHNGGDRYTVILTATIQKNWHIYSIKPTAEEIDFGPIPTSFEFEPQKGLKLTGSIKEEGKKTSKPDEGFDNVVVTYLEGVVHFKQEVVAAPGTKSVKGFLEYQACDDKRCLPPQDVEFDIALTPTSGSGGGSGTQSEPANPAPGTGDATPSAQPENPALGGGGTAAGTPQQADASTGLDYAPEEGQAIVPANPEKFESPKKETTSMMAIFISAFIAGLIALLTPCVFPMIPLTVSFFTKNKNSRQGVFQAGLFGIFIIVIYVALGLLVTIGFGPDILNEMSTNRVFNLIFFFLFIVFAMSFFGAFDLTLPSKWTNAADRNASKGGLVGVFFVAFTLVLVSFSCTGPIIGTLLVTAAVGGGYHGPIVGMTGFSLALALPFTLFAAFPSWMQSLPKSGGWLNSVKVTLGFLELALAFKFLVVPDQAYHWGLLKREYFLAIWIIIFVMLGFYLLGKLRFSHDSEMKSVSISRLMLSLFSFSFALYMVPGLFGAPVQALSGLAPPLHDNEGFLSHLMAPDKKTENDIPPALQPIKYTQYLKSPYGLTSYFDFDEAAAAAAKLQRPLFIDFTGHGCTNCRKMEESVWQNEKVKERLNRDFIVVQLYVDDRLSLDEKEVYVSAFNGKKIKTLGKKWSDFQTTRYQTNSQPYYIVADHAGNPVVQPRGYDPPTVESFIQFLDQGSEAFRESIRPPAAMK